MFAKYESYKDSGVEWIGQIPAHWEVKRVKHIAQVNPSIGKADKEEQITFLPMEAVSERGTYELKRIGKRKDFPSSLTDFNKCDVILAKITPCFENGKSACLENLLTEKGVGSTEFHVFRANRRIILPRFLYYLVSNPGYRSYAEAFMVGSAGQKRVTTSFIANSQFSIPSIIEQKQIATFLDEKTREIDDAIAKKQRLIELLQEQKAILINNAVTKGLNPDVPMKESGVAWIGQIPAHWEVSKLGYYSTVTNGSTPSRDVPRFWRNGSIPWISSGKVNDFIITSPSELISEYALQKCPLRVYPKGTVLLGIVGQGKTRGTSALLNIEACINQNLAAIEVYPKLNSEYIHRYLVSIYKEIRNYGKGSNQQALNCHLVKSIIIPIPPIEEQLTIVKHVKEIEVEISSLMIAIRKELEYLAELRTVLIAEAVTGKIKVAD